MEELLLFLKYIFLGALQGFTEPIPISSSGHLVIAQHLFGIESVGLSFEMFVNTASLLAVFFIYKTDIHRLVTSSYSFIFKKDQSQKDEFKFVVYLMIGTIPAGLFGIIFNDFISNNLKGIQTVGISLIVTAIALFIIRNLKGYKNDSKISWKDATLVGLGQAVALIPGISRSGATIVAAMLIGMKQETALRFSFLLYIPVSLGGIILEFDKLTEVQWTNSLITAYLLAFVVAFIASYFSLKWFMGIMRKGKLIYFSAYCLFIAIILLLMF